MKPIQKQSIALRRRMRVRSKITGTQNRPRVCVSPSLTGTFVQFIDDVKSVTIVSGSDKGIKGTKVARAQELGKKLGKDAVAKGIKQAILDRGSKKYHGRVKALTEALREAGVTI